MGNSHKKLTKDKEDAITTVHKPSYTLDEELIKEMNEISEERLRELRHVFKLFDKDGDQCIDASELKIVLSSIGQTPTDKDIAMMIEMADIDQNGTIDFEEFVIMMLWYTKNTNPEEELRQALRVFDRDGNGLISCQDLKLKMMTRGEMLTDEEAEEMVRDAAINGDGIIDCDKFIKLLCTPQEVDKSVSMTLEDD